MKQKIILKLSILFGLFLIFSSCKETVDESYFDNFIYKNDSNYSIEIEGYYNGTEYIFPISVDETLSQGLHSMGSVDDIIQKMDSIAITFNNERIVIFYQGVNTSSPFNILNLDNYTTTRVSDDESKHEYTFTIEDYNNAQ